MSETTTTPVSVTPAPEVPEVGAATDLPKGAPEPYPGEQVFTLEQAKKCRKKGFRDRRCRVVYVNKNIRPVEFVWWASTDGLNIGYPRDSSPIVKVSWATSIASSDNLLYVIMDEKLFTESAPKPKRCKIEDQVSAKTISMLKVAPMNETFRATLMSELGQMPPKEAQTYEQIKDWVEYNFPKEVPVSQAPPPPIGLLTVQAVRYGHVERGRADYSRMGSWTGTIAIPGERILQLAELSQNRSQFKERLYLTLKSMATNRRLSYNTPEPRNRDEIEYTDVSLSYAPQSYTDAINLLANHAPPPVLARLEITPALINPYFPRTPEHPDPIDDDYEEHQEEGRF